EGESVEGGNKWQFDIVPASVSVFDATFATAFKRVVRVASLRPPANAGGLAAIIEPSLVSANVDFSESGYGHISSMLAYQFTVHAPDGTTMDTITLDGMAAADQGFLSPVDSTHIVSLSLKNVAAELLATLAKREDLREKLEASAGSA